MFLQRNSFEDGVRKVRVFLGERFPLIVKPTLKKLMLVLLYTTRRTNDTQAVQKHFFGLAKKEPVVGFFFAGETNEQCQKPIELKLMLLGGTKLLSSILHDSQLYDPPLAAEP